VSLRGACDEAISAKADKKSEGSFWIEERSLVSGAQGGSKDPNYCGSKDPNYCGAKDPNYCGSKDPNYCGSKDPNYCGSKDPNYCGSVTRIRMMDER
jgi:hypothetical protein